MKKILGFVVLALVVPALAFAAKPAPGTSPAANQYKKPPKGHAYGYYCQNQSKKHVAGQKGTPFSQCVTAMAKLAKGTTTSPKAACAPLSHKRVAGQKGTPYSKCVVAGAQLLKDKR